MVVSLFFVSSRFVLMISLLAGHLYDRVRWSPRLLRHVFFRAATRGPFVPFHSALRADLEALVSGALVGEVVIKSVAACEGMDML